MDCSGAKRAPMVETKRNKAAIRLALSSAYSFGVALPMRLRIRIPRLNPATCVRRRLSIFSCLRKCVRRMPPASRCIIPLDGRLHLDERIRQLRGDARGHWEGDTLVVETTNFTAQSTFVGSGPNLRLVERFTRSDSHTLRYEFTLDDPESFTRPWTVVLPMRRSDGPVYEYACHEGNRSMTVILEVARAQERREAERN